MKKVVIVTTQYPWPIDNGKKVILNGLYQYFKARLPSRGLHWVVVGGNGQRDDGVERIEGVEVKEISGAAGIDKVLSVIFESFLFQRRSIQESIFFSRRIGLDINNYLDEVSPDLVVFDTVRLGQHCLSSFSRVNILYMDDLFSVRYTRMLAVIDQGVQLGGAALGNFRKFLPVGVANVIAKSNFLQKLLLKFERRMIKKSEIFQAQRFDAALLLNDAEATSLRDVCGSHVHTMTPWLQFDRPAVERAYDGRPRFVFLGALNIPHNEVGLLTFLETAFPKFLARHPDAELLVVGKSPTPRLIAAIDNHKNVKLLGFVEDLDGLLASCCGMVIPLVFGSGVKLKTLEAIARGVPVVTTEFGSEGIPLEHGVNCFLENNVDGFDSWMDFLVDPVINHKISSSALVMFNSVYSREPVFKNYDLMFGVKK